MNSFLTKPRCEKNNLFPAVYLFRVFVRATLSPIGQRDFQLGLYHKGTCLSTFQLSMFTIYLNVYGQIWA